MESKRLLTQKNLTKGAVPFIGCSSAVFIVAFLLFFGIFLFIFFSTTPVDTGPKQQIPSYLFIGAFFLLFVGVFCYGFRHLAKKTKTMQKAIDDGRFYIKVLKVVSCKHVYVHRDRGSSDYRTKVVFDDGSEWFWDGAYTEEMGKVYYGFFVDGFEGLSNVYPYSDWELSPELQAKVV